MSEVEQARSQEQTAISAPPSSDSASFKLVVEPLHRPQEMALVEVPHNVENIPHGATLMTGKALLAKKMAATGTSFYSPSDALVSPCTQKLSSQKGKRWANAKAKPTVFGKSNLNNASSMFSPQQQTAASAEDEDSLKPCAESPTKDESDIHTSSTDQIDSETVHVS